MSYKGPRFICLKQIAAMANASISSAGRYSKLPGFPDPFYFGGKKMWLGEEVWAWLMSCRRPGKA